MKRIAPGAAVVLLVAALWGCGGQPADPSSSALPSSAPTGEPSAPASSPSAAPSGSPVGSPVATPSATPSGRPAPSLPVNSVAKVVTNDLRVRSKPEVSDSSKKLTPLLDQPTLVYVVKGPVVASGFTWYEVAPLGNLERADELPFGWVAAADKDGTPWLATASPACPSKPKTVDALFAVDNVLALACFRGTSLTVDARIADPEATCGVDIGWDIDPSWLASTCPQPPFLVESPTSLGLSAIAVVDPSVNVKGFRPGPEPDEWLSVRLTGRFDHPAAKTCHGVSTSAPVPVSRDQIVLSCRATFVITKIAAR